MSSKNFRKVLLRAARIPFVGEIAHSVGSEGSEVPLSKESDHRQNEILDLLITDRSKDERDKEKHIFDDRAKNKIRKIHWQHYYKNAFSKYDVGEFQFFVGSFLVESRRTYLFYVRERE
jgi:hypothetical protein